MERIMWTEAARMMRGIYEDMFAEASSGATAAMDAEGRVDVAERELAGIMARLPEAAPDEAAALAVRRDWLRADRDEAIDLREHGGTVERACSRWMGTLAAALVEELACSNAAVLEQAGVEAFTEMLEPMLPEVGFSYIGGDAVVWIGATCTGPRIEDPLTPSHVLEVRRMPSTCRIVDAAEAFPRDADGAGRLAAEAAEAAAKAVEGVIGDALLLAPGDTYGLLATVSAELSRRLGI